MPRSRLPEPATAVATERREKRRLKSKTGFEESGTFFSSTCRFFSPDESGTFFSSTLKVSCVCVCVCVYSTLGILLRGWLGNATN